MIQKTATDTAPNIQYWPTPTGWFWLARLDGDHLAGRSRSEDAAKQDVVFALQRLRRL
jgi:hypothetical protein